ncbi:MAG: hypothetical protein Q9181_006345 [Wetmoreana brouardii]
MQRIQYSNDLKVPQAEIDLEELFEFLLDKGAVPDAKGIHMLRVSGLWTPTGPGLMLSPDSTQTALRVSMLDDSDGVLSLALQWKQEWNRRNHESLPPGWMRLNFPVKTLRTNDKDTTCAEKPAILDDGFAKHKTDDFEVLKSKELKQSTSNPPSYKPSPTSLRFQLSSIPSHPYASSVPCGVLVLLRLLSHNDALEWETPHPAAQHPLEIHEQFMAQNRMKAREMQMPEAERQRAQRARQQEGLAAMNIRVMKESRERHEREEKIERKAIASQRMGIGVVTKAALSYLVGAGQVVILDGNEDERDGEEKDADKFAVEALLVGFTRAFWGSVVKTLRGRLLSVGC